MVSLAKWNVFLKNYRNENPTLTYREAQLEASTAYNLAAGKIKKPKAPRKRKVPKAPKVAKVKVVKNPSMSSIERKLLADIRKKLNKCTREALYREKKVNYDANELF